jgi:hypothetical protein
MQSANPTSYITRLHLLAWACLLPLSLFAQTPQKWLPAVRGAHWVEVGEYTTTLLTRMPDASGPEYCDRWLPPLPAGAEIPSIQISSDHRFYKIHFEAYCFDTADWSNYKFCPGKAEDFDLSGSAPYIAKVHHDSLFFYKYYVDRKTLGKALARVPAVVRYRGDVERRWEKIYPPGYIKQLTAGEMKRRQRPPKLTIDTLGTLLPCTGAGGLDVIGRFGEPTTFEVNGCDYRIKSQREEGLIPGKELMWAPPYARFDNARQCWNLHPDWPTLGDSTRFSVDLFNRFPETLRVLQAKLDPHFVFRSSAEVATNELMKCTITVATEDYNRLKNTVLHLALKLDNGNTVKFNIGFIDS